jgi:hypothetical protein
MSRGAVAGNRPVSSRREQVIPPMMRGGGGMFGGAQMPPRFIPPAPPGTPQSPVGMAAGGYIPEGGFGQSPYNMGMNQMDPYAPMPTYMGQNPYGFVNGSSLAGGGTVGYMNGGPVGYPASAPQAAGIASLPLPRRYGI